jgi:hypothetical protein
MNTALQSSPDAIGLISWNEFSENSHIEPSENYGHQYVDVLANINSAVSPAIGNLASSEPGNNIQEMSTSRVAALGIILALTIIGLVMIARRNY